MSLAATEGVYVPGPGKSLVKSIAMTRLFLLVGTRKVGTHELRSFERICLPSALILRCSGYVPGPGVFDVTAM